MKIIINVDFNEKLDEWTATGLTYDDSMDSPGILPTCNAESQEEALESLLKDLQDSMALIRKSKTSANENPQDLKIFQLEIGVDDRKALREEIKKLSGYTRCFTENVIDLVQSVDEIEAKIFHKVIEHVNRDR